MSDLTEVEIFDRMHTSLGEAIDAAEKLSRIQSRGPNYDKLRKALHLIEGCARQAAMWRQDARWLFVGDVCAEYYRRAGGWLRGVKNAEGRKVKLADGQLHPLFVMLADQLRMIRQAALDMKTKPTHQVGTILPEVQKGSHRDTVPVGWRKLGHLVIPGHA